MYVCMYAYSIHVFMYVCMHIVYMCKHVCMQVCMHEYSIQYMYVCIYYTCVCMYVCCSNTLMAGTRARTVSNLSSSDTNSPGTTMSPRPSRLNSPLMPAAASASTRGKSSLIGPSKDLATVTWLVRGRMYTVGVVFF